MPRGVSSFAVSASVGSFTGCSYGLQDVFAFGWVFLVFVAV